MRQRVTASTSFGLGGQAGEVGGSRDYVQENLRRLFSNTGQPATPALGRDMPRWLSGTCVVLFSSNKSPGVVALGGRGFASCLVYS